jgi:hypothetical protein
MNCGLGLGICSQNMCSASSVERRYLQQSHTFERDFETPLLPTKNWPDSLSQELFGRLETCQSPKPPIVFSSQILSILSSFPVNHLNHG